jgi:hypothetical protein
VTTVLAWTFVVLGYAQPAGILPTPTQMRFSTVEACLAAAVALDAAGYATAPRHGNAPGCWPDNPDVTDNDRPGASPKRPGLE